LRTTAPVATDKVTGVNYFFSLATIGLPGSWEADGGFRSPQNRSLPKAFLWEEGLTQLANQQTGQLAGHPTRKQANRPTGRPADRPTGRPADRPTGRLADWLTG